jgi:hypothetical protein
VYRPNARLGWTLENCGVIHPVQDETREEFIRRSIEQGRATDIPLLIDIFRSLKGLV